MVTTPAPLGFRQGLFLNENIHVFDVPVHIVGPLERVGVRYDVDADEDRQEKDDKRIGRQRRMDQARENQIKGDNREQADEPEIDGVF